MRRLLISIMVMVMAVSPAMVTAENLDDSRMVNPMLWADVPDPDVIRVGEYFYMVTTTMHLMPGCPVMRSRDLVNWEVISYVFDTLDDSPYYRLEGGTVYGKGQWATSLRYHDGMFYVLFSPNDHPYRSYIYKTADPAGEWTQVSRTDHFHDSSLLFDDDGRVYVYSGSGAITLTELQPDLSGVKPDGVKKCVIDSDAFEPGFHEGSRAIKYNGKYYLLIIAWPQGGPRRQLCYRADSVTGPYEQMVILQDAFAGFPYVGQGCIVDDAAGNWWGVIFQDRGGVGRVLTLVPCRWTDGWPILGDENGRVPLVVDKPVTGEYSSGIVTSDDFTSSRLNKNWQWNHCPVNEAWSLDEAPGRLRLKTSRVVSNIYEAPNTVSQRMEGPECEGVVKVDISHMRTGDVAGFGAFNGHSGLLSVTKKADGHYLTVTSTTVNFKNDSKIIDSVDEEVMRSIKLPADVNNIYLRINADFRVGRDIARFAYSTDGIDWTDTGDEFKMRFDYRRLFMGTRFAIYNYATEAPGGYIDVDRFDYRRVPNTVSDMAGELTNMNHTGIFR